MKRNVADGTFAMIKNQHRIDIMETYDPERGPEPESWLELDKQERIFVVEAWHRGARARLPNVTAHATLHAIVENQIALNLEPVVRAMHRGRSPGKELKSVQLSSGERMAFAGELAKIRARRPDIRFVTITVRKEKANSAFRRTPNGLYNFMAKLLLPEVMSE